MATWRRGIVLDALARHGELWKLLQPLLGDSRVYTVFHGHINHCNSLYYNFDIEVNTTIIDAAANSEELDGRWEDEQRASLQTLRRQYLRYELPQTHQAPDWKKRPMDARMIQKAAIDAMVLLPLHAAMAKEMHSRTTTCFAGENEPWEQA